MKKILLLLTILVVGACSSTDVKDAKQYTQEEVKNWDKTLVESIVENSFLPEWYGNENPILYLKKSGTFTEKHFKFFKELEEKEVIADEDIIEFNKLVKKYNGSLDREFKLEDHNIKNPKALVNKIVISSYLRISNPSNYIYNNVATKDEWNTLLTLSKQEDLSKKDVTKLRKILNNFIKKKNFFNERSWYGVEISGRVKDLVEKSSRPLLTKRQINNINAKALYIAYQEYFSDLDKWKD